MFACKPTRSLTMGAALVLFLVLAAPVTAAPPSNPLVGSWETLDEVVEGPLQWRVEDGGNGHWYRLSPRPVEGLDDAIQLVAETIWLGQPGYVVSVLSEGEKDFLVDTFGSETLYLIGYTDRDEEGVWSWVSDEPSGYEFWASDEPNNFNDEDYAVMNWQHEVQPEPQPPGAWNDLGGWGGYAIFEYEGLAVSIDIQPGQYPNSLNIDGHGVIPVAVLGSESFDVTQIDVATLDFADLAVKANKKGKVQCSFDDVSGDFTTPEGAPDGSIDLVCQFVDDPARWNPDNGTATLTGWLLPEFGGTAFTGSDTYRLVPVGKQSVPLVVWAQSSYASGLDTAAAQFTMDTGIEVVIETFENFDIRDPLNDAAATGHGPDIFVGAHDWTVQLVEGGLVQPVDLTPLVTEFVPVSVEAVRYQGQSWALPSDFAAIALFYNQDLVGTPPSTFEGLGLSCDAMTGIDNCVGLQMSDPYHHYAFLTAFGGYVFGYDPATGYDASDVGLDSTGAIAGAEFLETQVQAGVIGQTGDYGETMDLFLAGVQPYWLTGQWVVGTVNDAGMNWGVIPIPTMDGKVPGPFVGVRGFFLGAYGEQDAAADFLLEYVATTEAMIALHSATSQTPAHLGAVEAIGDEAIEAFMTSAAAGEPMPNIPEMAFAWSPMLDAFDAIRTGALPAAEAMETAAQAVRESIGN